MFQGLLLFISAYQIEINYTVATSNKLNHALFPVEGEKCS